MRIPAIQRRMRELATAHGLAELADLADALSRRRPRRIAPASSTTITPALRTALRAYSVAHPQMSQVEIARLFNVNPGRVSEAIRGLRQ